MLQVGQEDKKGESCLEGLSDTGAKQRIQHWRTWGNASQTDFDDRGAQIGLALGLTVVIIMSRWNEFRRDVNR